MAFPVIVSILQGTQAVDASTWTLTYPTGLHKGDIVLAAFGMDGNVTITTVPGGTGWDLAHGHETGGNVCFNAAKHVAAGTETGTFDMGFSGSEQGCWTVIVISGWNGSTETEMGFSFLGGALQGSGTADGTSTSPNPNGFSQPTAWGRSDMLFMTFGVADGGDTTFTVIPTNYTLLGNAQNSGGANGSAMAIAYRITSVALEDPGAFTISVSEQWVANNYVTQGPDATRFGSPRAMAGVGT